MTCTYDCSYCRGKARHRKMAQLYKRGFSYAAIAAQEGVSISFVRKMVVKGSQQKGDQV